MNQTEKYPILKSAVKQGYVSDVKNVLEFPTWEYSLVCRLLKVSDSLNHVVKTIKLEEIPGNQILHSWRDGTLEKLLKLRKKEKESLFNILEEIDEMLKSKENVCPKETRQQQKKNQRSRIRIKTVTNDEPHAVDPQKKGIPEKKVAYEVSATEKKVSNEANATEKTVSNKTSAAEKKVSNKVSTAEKKVSHEAAHIESPGVGAVSTDDKRKTARIKESPTTMKKTKEKLPSKSPSKGMVKQPKTEGPGVEASSSTQQVLIESNKRQSSLEEFVNVKPSRKRKRDSVVVSKKTSSSKKAHMKRSKANSDDVTLKCTGDVLLKTPRAQRRASANAIIKARASIHNESHSNSAGRERKRRRYSEGCAPNWMSADINDPIYKDLVINRKLLPKEMPEGFLFSFSGKRTENQWMIECCRCFAHSFSNTQRSIKSIFNDITNKNYRKKGEPISIKFELDPKRLDRTTHLIVPESAERPTLKILYAIAHGQLVLQSSYLHALHQKREFPLTTEETEAHEHGEFPTLRKRTTTSAPMKDKIIHLLGDFVLPGIPKRDLICLIEQTGGTVHSNLRRSHVTVLADNVGRVPESLMRAMEDNENIVVCSVRWLVESIASWSFITEYKLYEPLVVRMMRTRISAKNALEASANSVPKSEAQSGPSHPAKTRVDALASTTTKELPSPCDSKDGDATEITQIINTAVFSDMTTDDTEQECCQDENANSCHDNNETDAAMPVDSCPNGSISRQLSDSIDNSMTGSPASTCVHQQMGNSLRMDDISSPISSVGPLSPGF